MKNKGFTLVEIIGVIVLLVAIAFIVYPSVINVINNSRDKAYQSQVNTIIKSARTYVMEKYSGMSKNYKIVVRNIKDYGLLSYNDIIDPRNNSNMENLCVNAKWNKNINQHEYSIGECTNSSYIGKVIYYDPVNHSLCNTYTESNSASGTIEGCLKWNILSENEDGTFNLLLDHNIVSGVQWASKTNYVTAGGDGEAYDASTYTSSGNTYVAGLNDKGPLTIVSSLNTATSTWHSSLTRTDSYQDYNGDTLKYTVNYNGMKARLPEAQEIASAVGHPTYNQNTSSSWFYLDSLNTTIIVGYGKDKKISDYAWLYNNLGNGSQDVTNTDSCLYYGCSETQAKSSGDYAYWTSTSVAGYSSQAWHVGFSGSLGSNYVANANYGVRPVITLSLEILGNDRIGDSVYYNPVNDSVRCETYIESNSTSGVVEGCLKWYVLSENENGTVNLLLDHNILSGVQWHGTDNMQGPTVAKEALNNAIKDKWSDNLLRNDSYSHTFNNGTENKTYTVNYNGMKARLPEAGEIAVAVGYSAFRESSTAAWFYFDSLNQIQTVGYGYEKPISEYEWLFNNLGGGTSTDISSSSTCLYYGCTMAKINSSGDHGYWTSTAVAGYSSDAWRVSGSGGLDFRSVVLTYYGIRPVITISSIIIAE